jgi:uncharacterized protein YndB with AHSA1/START domain
MSVERDIEIEASPEEVWEAIATEEGRERWLGEEERDVLVETVEEPFRLVWWWRADDEAWSRVEVTLVPAVSSTRVVVRESVPTFPLAPLALAFAGAPA